MTVVQPILIMECPQGHFWPRVDPRWISGTVATQRTTMWCPDHQAERKTDTLEKIQAEKTRRSKEYDALPWPTTKRCTNPHPLRHAVTDALSIADFYTRPGKHRADGTRGMYLDSRCKMCRQDEAYIRRQNPSYSRPNTNGVYYHPEIVNGKTMVDPTLFNEWCHWIKPLLSDSEARAISRAKDGDTDGLQITIVDAVMTRYGATDQFMVFYG